MRPGRRARPLLAALAVAALLSAGAARPAEAAQVVVAFGDSITLGEVFDEENQGGYPGRLQRILRNADAGFDDVVVYNFGLGGDTTSAGVSRIGGAISFVQGDDVEAFLIMSGTNDVNLIRDGTISIQSVANNVEAMAARVRGAGHKAIYSTIIPRPRFASRDNRNETTFALVVALRELAAGGNRPMAEPWEVFFFHPQRDTSIYYTDGFDPVGHPNAAGFDLLAELFADKVLGLDSLPPVFSSVLLKTGDLDRIRNNDVLTMLLHESGEGIAKKRTYFTINGKEVPTDVKGNKRRVELEHTVDKDTLGCVGRVGAHVEDLAEPPNIRRLFLVDYDVANRRKPPVGDVDGDCRVDGADLVLFIRAFGSRRGDERYDDLLDFNNDGKIGGKDFSRLASNWGKDRSE